jgi:hypothetical protein
MDGGGNIQPMQFDSNDDRLCHCPMGGITCSTYRGVGECKSLGIPVYQLLGERRGGGSGSW